MTSTPHDALFKSVFQHPEHAAAELRHVLPPEISRAIRWDTLKLEPGSYVDPALAKRHSDLLFSAQAEIGGITVLIYLLFEHQSTNDTMMALRLLEYEVRVWNRRRKDHPDEPLPVIIPVVLSHVPGGWTAATRFAELFSPGLGHLRAHIPDFSFTVDDLHHVSDNALRERALADFPKVALWLMRDARDAETLLARLAEWAPLLEDIMSAPNGREAMLVLLRYIALVCKEMHFDRFRATIEKIAPSTEADAMTTIAEQLRAESKVESLLLVLRGRKLAVTAEQKTRLEQCTDPDTLDQWLVRAVTASETAELFED